MTVVEARVERRAVVARVEVTVVVMVEKEAPAVGLEVVAKAADSAEGKESAVVVRVEVARAGAAMVVAARGAAARAGAARGAAVRVAVGRGR